MKLEIPENQQQLATDIVFLSVALFGLGSMMFATYVITKLIVWGSL